MRGSKDRTKQTEMHLCRLGDYANSKHRLSQNTSTDIMQFLPKSYKNTRNGDKSLPNFVLTGKETSS